MLSKKIFDLVNAKNLKKASAEAIDKPFIDEVLGNLISVATSGQTFTAVRIPDSKSGDGVIENLINREFSVHEMSRDPAGTWYNVSWE